MSTDFTAAFRDAIAQAGLTAPEVIQTDGALHRFATNGKASDAAGWYIYHADGIPAGAFGCWRSDIYSSWRADIGRQYSEEENRAHLAKTKAMRKARDAEKLRGQEEASVKAAKLWESASPATDDHPYLKRKCVRPHGIRVNGDGVLLVPMRDTAGKLWNLERIFPNGDKRGLFRGRRSGCYFSMGGVDELEAICCVEGFATGASVREATLLPVAVTFDKVNLVKAVKALREKYPKIQLVICADDDYRTDGNPGLAKAKEAAEAVGGVVAIPDFGISRPEGATDFNDLHLVHGLDAVFNQIKAARAQERYPLIWVSQAKAHIERPSLIRGVIKPKSMIVTYGDPNSGKSFHCLDRDLCLARGVNWYDRETEPGFVLYIAAEGAHSIEDRLTAYRDARIPESIDVPFALLPKSINLSKSGADTSLIVDFIKRMEDRRGIKCIKVTADTLARVMAGGNENSPEDMGALVDNADHIRAKIECAFEFIHHSGKDTAKGARGHSSLRAATDTEIEVVASDGIHIAKVTKQRDFGSGGEFAFSLRVVELGTDKYGHPITTCVPEWQNAPPKREKLNKTELAVLAMMKDIMKREQKFPPSSCQEAPRPPKTGQIACPVAALRELVRRSGRLSSSDKPDSHQRALRRALNTLQDRAVIGVFDGWAWLTDKADKSGQNEKCPVGHGSEGAGRTGHPPLGVSGLSGPRPAPPNSGMAEEEKTPFDEGIL